MPEERDPRQASGRLKIGRCSASAVIGSAVVVLAVLGCGSTTTPVGHSLNTREVLLLVSVNSLSGEPWPIAFASASEQQAMLETALPFKRGRYTVSALCKEITRASGKRVEWLPDTEEAAEAIEAYWGEELSLPPPATAPKEDALSVASRCSVPLGMVLEHLVSLVTEAELHTDSLKRGIWTAWIGNEAIFLVLLPRDHSLSQGLESKSRRGEQFEQKPGSPPAAGRRSVTVVLPVNRFVPTHLIPLVTPEESAPWPPAVPPMEQQEVALAQVAHLREGQYTVDAFVKEMARAYGRRIDWLPGLQHAAKPQQRFAEVALFHVGRAEPRANSRDVGVQLEPQMTLGKVLRVLLEVVTEIGVGRRSPDREVWAALVADEKIVLIMLPDAY